MSTSNGNSNFPPRDVMRNVGDIWHDAVTLAELQTELFKVDAVQWIRSLVMPLVSFAAALLILIGCIPVALASLAWLLVEQAGWTYAASFLTAALAGLALVAVAVLAGWWKLRQGQAAFAQSREELSRNVQWVKTVLKEKSTPAGRCPPASEQVPPRWSPSDSRYNR